MEGKTQVHDLCASELHSLFVETRKSVKVRLTQYTHYPAKDAH